MHASSLLLSEHWSPGIFSSLISFFMTTTGPSWSTPQPPPAPPAPSASHWTRGCRPLSEDTPPSTDLNILLFCETGSQYQDPALEVDVIIVYPTSFPPGPGFIRNPLPRCIVGGGFINSAPLASCFLGRIGLTRALKRTHRVQIQYNPRPAMIMFWFSKFLFVFYVCD